MVAQVEEQADTHVWLGHVHAQQLWRDELGIRRSKPGVVAACSVVVMSTLPRCNAHNMNEQDTAPYQDIQRLISSWQNLQEQGSVPLEMSAQGHASM